MHITMERLFDKNMYSEASEKYQSQKFGVWLSA